MAGFDLGVIPLAKRDSLQEIASSLKPFDGREGVVSGLAKLSQSVIWLFLTEPGSVVADTSLGASPVRQLQALSGLVPSDVDGILSESVAGIRNQISRWNGTTASANEQLGELRIVATDIDLELGKIFIEISLSSAAGDVAEYAVDLLIPTAMEG